MRRGQAAFGEEVAKGVRRGREAAGDADARRGQLADHFAEGGVLAADRLDVGHSQVFETGRRGRSPGGWMTWEDSVVVKNRGHPTCDGGAGAVRPSVAGRAASPAATVGVATVARGGGEHGAGVEEPADSKSGAVSGATSAYHDR